MQIENNRKNGNHEVLYPQSKLSIQRGDLTRIAEKCGVTHAHASKWYNCKYKNRIEDHQKLMDALLSIIEERAKIEEKLQERIKRIRSLS
jgi:hypothetical protein